MPEILSDMVGFRGFGKKGAEILTVSPSRTSKISEQYPLLGFRGRSRIITGIVLSKNFIIVISIVTITRFALDKISGNRIFRRFFLFHKFSHLHGNKCSEENKNKHNGIFQKLFHNQLLMRDKCNDIQIKKIAKLHRLFS